MQSLILCAGDRVGGAHLAQRWIPNLRQCYSGDIVLLDFDIEARWKQLLESDPHVVLEPCQWDHRGREYVGVVRHDQYLRLLEGPCSQYDAVLCVDSDTVFQSSLDPLFAFLSVSVCCVAERALNRQWRVLVGDDAAWEAIRNEPMMNCGVYGGPRERVVEVERFLIEGCRVFPTDQSWLNVLVYQKHYPVHVLEETWNFSRSYLPVQRNGVWETPEGKTIHIFHSH